MKKVSVIIPVYRTLEFLEECLESVRKQTYNALEIIVVSDGADEESRRIIRSYAAKDSRIHAIFSEERKGVGHARNVGLDTATGDFVYFLDSDDCLPHATIQCLVEHIGDYEMLSGRLKKMTVKPVLGEEEEQHHKVLRNRNRARLFRNNSVLNRLISRPFIEKHTLRFSQEVEGYSDLAFLVPALIHIEYVPYVTGCVYYKRKRNDPITNPALSQRERQIKVADFLCMFNLLKEQYREHQEVTTFLDRQFLNYYRKTVIMLLEDPEQVDQMFANVAHAVKQVDQLAMGTTNPIVKAELQQLYKEKQRTYRFLIRLHHFLRQAKRALKSKRKAFIFLYRQWFLKMPVKKKLIVFESFLGKNYSDSPKNIYEELQRSKQGYQCVWVFNEKRRIPGKAKQVKRFSLRYYYYTARAKYWVTNSRLPMHLDKRPDNVYLQTWHGTPLKKLVFDMNEVYSANPDYKKHFYTQSRRWDYLIAANHYSSEIFRRAFKFDKQMLEYGYPRNDVLHDKDRDQQAYRLKQKLGIPLDKKVILYAPTWRDDDFYEPGKYKFQLRLDLQRMKEKLGDTYVILLRMHYFIADHVDTSGAEGFAYNFSTYNDIADLYLLSDVLITDYSSVFFDYANLKRPILFYTYDLEKYRDTLRGFYINIEEEVPGPLLRDSEAVIATLLNLDETVKAYEANYERFYEKFCGWEQGNATKKVIDHVFGSSL
ncbi:teichoic acid biosynthesis protein F [Fictibacillus macauensis ZFHKF-1]|uniref:Teichoic acid biosynthesis protein F n=1 Tax=Fictibacillus macauensis ZFHKF-1 TaxID=1196324 RepID=I8AE58_9BACL|nr:CDP-glycerol:glycerophosphate glycerophosphotransferase [Fictibacillus macauensis]EIT83872.1 teichoic acid biosynthesis protein F [Fictibacillus macauensis ZFHKF-1]